MSVKQKLKSDGTANKLKAKTTIYQMKHHKKLYSEINSHLYRRSNMLLPRCLFHITRTTRFVALILVWNILLLLPTTAIAASSQQQEQQHHDNSAHNKALHYLQQGNNAYGSGNLQIALQAYEKCLDADASLQWCLVNLASVLVDLADMEQGVDDGSNGKSNKLIRAEQLYRQVLQDNPADGDTAFNLALLLQDVREKTDEDSLREVASLYDIAVASDPSRWDAWANMASVLAELKEEPLKAIYSYERSIVIIEDTMMGDDENETNEENNRARDTYLSKLYYGYGILLSDLSPDGCSVLEKAPQSLYVTKRQQTQDNSNTDKSKEEKEDEESLLGTELCMEHAQIAMRKASHLDRTNVQAIHMLAAIMAESSSNTSSDEDPTVHRATPEFVAALFDDFADTFDTKLVGALQYKVPRLIGAAAIQASKKHHTNKFQSALDAGCGTGLAGPYLRPIVDGPMVGVDISQKMLDKAAMCTTETGCGREEETKNDDNQSSSRHGDTAPPLYDGLMALDLEIMTLEQTLGTAVVHNEKASLYAGFDLVVAADVLVYFGSLEKVIANFANLSMDGASLIFSCERLTPTTTKEIGWKLLSSGRFAHTKAYVVKVANHVGYDLVDYQEIIPRMEKGVEVQGHLFSFILKKEEESTRKDNVDANAKEEL